jgi:hypothetical protein
MNDSSKVFDRLTLLVCLIGVLVMATALVGATRGTASDATEGRTTIDVSLTEFAITGDLAVPPGLVSLRVTNNGSIPHNLSVVDGASTPDLSPGEAPPSTSVNWHQEHIGCCAVFPAMSRRG